ncbi:MAG: hypothetical protein JSV88_25205, partial [Candidatus Aminicenantes bacterium]
MKPGMTLTVFKNSTLKGIIFILGVLAFGLLFLVPGNLDSEETGFKYLKNYTYKDYEHQPQNWGMAQDQDGIIYAANNGGVLIYDGVSWRVMGIPQYTTARSLAVDETGTVYIGGKGEIGYLKSDEKGFLQYKSLMNHLEEDQRNFSDVWRTTATKEGIYFSSSQFLFRWDPKQEQMKAWKPTHRFIYPFIVEGKLFIHQQKVGLMQMVNDSLKLLPGGETFADAVETIFMIVPYDNNDPQTLLIGTRLRGFYLHDYNGRTLMPFPTEIDEYLKSNIASHGTRLSSGDFALATRLGGLVIIDCRGHLKYIYDKTSGLQDGNIKYIFEDNQGNLWLCLDNGISKIEFASPFFVYNGRSDLPGIALSVIRYHKGLYVGTTKGLYVLRPGSKTFHPAAGISSNCWDLLSIDNSLLAATTDGVFQVDNKTDKKQMVISGCSYVLLKSTHYPKHIWCGTRSGLAVLIRNNSRWVEEHRYKAINQSIRFIAEDKNGNLWLATSKGRLLKVDFLVDINHPIVTPYNIEHVQPGGWVYVAVAAGHVMFTTKNGIFRFDDKRKDFIPDMTLGPEFAGGPKAKPVFRLVEDKNKNIWFHSKSMNYKAVPGSEGSYTIEPNPFRRIPMAQVNTIYPDPDSKNIWFGSHDGLIRYDTTVKKNYRQHFKTMVRKVSANENLIFDGHRNKSSKTSGGLVPTFEYKDRNLHFEFAAPYFEAETETQYQYFLEGYDRDWSAWNKDFKRDYTNLDSMLYTFRVRARNVYQHMSSEDAFRFKVLPPWYKTWWAYVFYVILFFLLMFLVVKWRSARLEHEKQKLENTIKERTKEINDKNQQLEEQTLKLKDQSEKLKEMDQLKSRFFANISHEFRTPLTLIRSPLEKMLADSRDREQKKELRVMRRSSQRLLTLINQLLDLSRFDSGKMELQAACQNIVPFLKGTVASFHMVAVENQLELVFHSEEGEIPLYFDAGKMEEVMYNLLINAIKFTPPGGKISVSVIVGKSQQDQAKEEVDFVYISVRDTGPGISQEQLVHIFDRFYQAEGLKGRGHKGTGIGLALTKEIVLLHHGKIDVHSQEGKGTEFVIQLPMGREHLKPGQIVSPSEAAPGKGKVKEIETLYVTRGEEGEEEEDNGDTGEIEPVGDIETEDHENKIHLQEKNVILVVEDEAEVRGYIRVPLEASYDVVEAENGKEGIAKAKEIIPDLIVSDIMMP